MAAKNICDLAEILLRYSKKPAMKLAVIEQATTIHQQVHTTTLIDCAKDFAGKTFQLTFISYHRRCSKIA